MKYEDIVPAKRADAKSRWQITMWALFGNDDGGLYGERDNWNPAGIIRGYKVSTALLWWLRNPRGAGFRVPLMGVVRKWQSTRLASQLAFMMIEYIRRYAVARHGTKRAEVGWILEDNQGMVAIADAIGSKVNREYRIYSKDL